MKKTVHLDVTWVASSDRQYEIPLTLFLNYDSSYGSDADGNRGVGVWEFEDYELDGLDESQLHTIITDPDDLEEFSLDILSETAFELALDNMHE